MKRNIFLTVILFTTIFLFSCSRCPSDSSNYMILNEVKYVTEFPQIFSLQDNIEPNIDIIGIKSFAIYDSIMILSTTNKDGLWSFISLPTYDFLGNFLTRGEGPFEFIEPPSVSNKVKIQKEKKQLFAYIYDFQKGKILKMNISESIDKNKLNISLFKDSLPPFLFNVLMIDSNKFLCKEANNIQTQQIRYINNENNNTTPNPLQNLNKVSIREGDDINILSTIAKLSSDNNLIVEMPIGLNYINLYSIDGSLGKTICVGNSLDNIDKIQDKKRWDRIYTFADLRVFPDFFGVVYINEDEKTFQTKRERLPSILLFDWQGEPLAEVKLNHFITSFDIDFTNGSLYTLDVHSDEFYKYDIKNILSKILHK